MGREEQSGVGGGGGERAGNHKTVYLVHRFEPKVGGWELSRYLLFAG